MTLHQAASTITAINGVAANVRASLACLTLDAINKQASFGLDVDHRLHFETSPAFAVGATLKVDGSTYRVVRMRPACHRPGEALLKML